MRCAYLFARKAGAARLGRMRPEPVDIAQTVVYGVAFGPKNSDRVARMDLNDLYASVGRLFDLLDERRIDYVLVGGIAMLSYVEGRNTQDIDLIVAEADLARLPELRVDERNERFARTWLGELRVDVLFAENEPFKTVRERHTTPVSFADRAVTGPTAIGLLLMKLYALPSLYRQGQFKKVRIYEGDVADLLELPAEVSAEIWQTLGQILMDGDVVELRRLVEDRESRSRARAERFDTDNDPR